jgi:hypothetical protein
VWPVKATPGAPRNGFPLNERIEPGTLYDRLRDIADGTPVVQLNHPRADSTGSIGLGYFTNFGFSPLVAVPATDTGGTNGFLRRKSARGTENLAFDAIEVLNGANWDNLFYNEQNRADWFALLRQGFLKTGMANSDSHRVVYECAGYPRSYVRFSAETPVSLTTGDAAAKAALETFDASIRKMQVMGTNGPVIHATVEGADSGDVVVPADRHAVQLAVKVESAPWIPVEEVRVLVNGEPACTIGRAGAVPGPAAKTCPAGLADEPADPFGTAGVLRYQQTIVLDLAKDSFVVVEAGMKLPEGKDLDGDGVLDTWDANGDGVVDARDQAAGVIPAPAAPALTDALVPGMLPWGFTNPVFVDVDGGGWTPPGL